MKKYKSLIFDCDGVILNSNQLKTNAFRKVFEKYNINAVDEFIEYHRSNGGVSRYIKIENFLKNILLRENLKILSQIMYLLDQNLLLI